MRMVEIYNTLGFSVVSGSVWDVDAVRARRIHVNFYFINVKSYQKCFGLDFPFFFSLFTQSLASFIFTQFRPFNLTFAN